MGQKEYLCKKKKKRKKKEKTLLCENTDHFHITTTLQHHRAGHCGLGYCGLLRQQKIYGAGMKKMQKKRFKKNLHGDTFLIVP